jgi:hypothetical protein
MPVLQSKLKKDMANALAEGFRPVAAAQSNLVLLERCAETPKIDPISAADMYRVVGFGDLKDREKKIEVSATEGYRIIESRFGWRLNQPPEFVMLLERTTEKVDYKYIVIDSKLPKQGDAPKDQLADFEKQLSEVAQAGYRLSARPVGRFHFTGWATPWTELSALLEKSLLRYEYRLVNEQDTSSLSRKLTELRLQSFRLLPMGLLGSDIAVVERVVRDGEHAK